MPPAKRLLLAFYSPKAVFDAIAEKPTWLIASIVLAVLSALSGVVIASRLDLDAAIAARMSGQDVPPEAAEAALKFAHAFQYIGPVVSGLMVPLFLALVALLFWAGLKLMATEDTKFAPVFSATLHAWWPASLVASVFGVITALTHAKLTPEEAQRLVKSNVAAFMSADAHPALLALLGSIDVFSVWIMVLLIFGLSVVGKTSLAKSSAIVVVLWAVHVVLKVGGAFLQSMLGGG